MCSLKALRLEQQENCGANANVLFGLVSANLLESKNQAETVRDDILIRRFVTGTFHDLLASEIIIKRKQNTVTLSFLICCPRNFYPQKTYFLVGYSEELLSSLLKCVVKIDVQHIYSKNDLVFRLW